MPDKQNFGEKLLDSFSIKDDTASAPSLDVDKMLDMNVKELVKMAVDNHWSMDKLDRWLRIKEIRYLELIARS